MFGWFRRKPPILTLPDWGAQIIRLWEAINQTGVAVTEVARIVKRTAMDITQIQAQIDNIKANQDAFAADVSTISDRLENIQADIDALRGQIPSQGGLTEAEAQNVLDQLVALGTALGNTKTALDAAATKAQTVSDIVPG